MENKELYKVEIIGETEGYWSLEDYKEFYNDIVGEEGKDFADKYFATGEFDKDFPEENSDKHFLYGYLEGLVQRVGCPSFVYEDKNLNYKVSKVIQYK